MVEVMFFHHQNTITKVWNEQTSTLHHCHPVLRYKNKYMLCFYEMQNFFQMKLLLNIYSLYFYIKHLRASKTPSSSAKM